MSITPELKQVQDSILENTKQLFESLKGKQDELAESVKRAHVKYDNLEMEVERGNTYAREHSSNQWKELESPAARVIFDSQEFKHFASTNGKGSIAFRLPLSLLTKATITSGAIGSSTPGILVPQRAVGIVKPGIRRVRVRELMNVYPTRNNAVEYVKEDAFTNNVSPQIEASGKSESALTFSIQSAPVITLAHWVPATRQILDDFAPLQEYLDQRLVDGINDKEDAEILMGDGTGQHLHGLIYQATPYDSDLNNAGDTAVDRVLNGITQLEGAFRPGAALWDRMETIVEVSSSHADFFTRNLLAIRAECRIALSVYRGDCFVYGAF